MLELNRRLIRAACRLQSAYAAAAPDRSRVDLPHTAWDDVQAAYRAWSIACDRDWRAIAELKREALVREFEHLGSQLRSRVAMLVNERPPQIPQLRLLYEELVAADGEFDGVQFEEGELSVMTEPISLDDIELGRFQIRLHLKRLGNDAPYSVTALDPNPAASCSETTHPHVSGGRLCPGEGRSAIAAALVEGRVFDFFTIVDRILHTYAVGSAYVELDQWDGVSCHDCDSSIEEEDACTCNRCEERICGDCLCCCNGCGDGFCSGCLDRCYRCEEATCNHCLVRCEDCRHCVCPSCREDDLCETCREQREEQADEDESATTETEPLTSAPESSV